MVIRSLSGDSTSLDMVDLLLLCDDGAMTWYYCTRIVMLLFTLRARLEMSESRDRLEGLIASHVEVTRLMGAGIGEIFCEPSF